MKSNFTVKPILLLAFLFYFINFNSHAIFAQPPEIQSVEVEQLNLRNMQPNILFSHFALLTIGY
jgi:hypothetical protein